MASKLSELKNALGAGARSSKYRINFSIPSAVKTSSNLQDVDVLCKATSFPSKTMGQIMVYNQGRLLPIPGDTTFTTTWNVTFYNTEAHDLRRDLISWMQATDDFQNNLHSGNPASVMGELSVEQLDSAGNATAKYTFHNVWVNEIAEIAVGDDQVDTLQEFDCIFSFSDWVLGDGESDNFGSVQPATKNPTSN